MAAMQPDRVSLLTEADNKALRSASVSFLNACSKTEQKKNNTYIVLDFETTGIDMYSNEIIEYAAVKVTGNELGDSIQSLCKPYYPIPYAATQVNGITNRMVSGEAYFTEHLDTLLDFIGDGIVVAHNASFDVGFLNKYCAMMKRPLITQCACTMRMARWVLYGKLGSYRLAAVASHLGVGAAGYHRAMEDAVTAARVLLELAKLKKE
jgi:DNA polymerase III subunit alpha, Gram-positive type